MYRTLIPLVVLGACQQIGPSTYVLPAPLPEGNALTSLSTLPVVGSARYDGRLGVGFGAADADLNERLVGDLVVIADFQRDTVSGAAQAFEDRLTGERLRGAVPIAGIFDRQADLSRVYGMAATAQGQVLGQQGQDITVDLTLDGDFRGRTGKTVVGNVQGTVKGLALTPDDDVTGTFLVQR